MLKAVLFDVGNVLLRLKTREFLAAVEAACPGLDSATMLAELRAEGSVHHAYERGQVSGEGFHAHFRERYQLPWDYPTWLSHWNDYFLVNRPMEVLVAKLRGKVKLYGLSNTNAEHYTHFTRNFRLFEAFDQVLGSHQYASRKPEEKFFRAALEKIGEPADTVLFLDDVAPFVEKARSLGLQGFHYTFNDLELKARIAELGLELPHWDERQSPYSC